MPWQTAHGARIEWPHKLYAQAAKNPNRETMMELLTAVQKIQGAITDMDNEIIQLRVQNQRLRHENQFMIRQLNLKEEPTT